MAINMRKNRVEDCCDLDVGNYSNILWYRPADFEQLHQIRTSVKQLKRATDSAPPPAWESSFKGEFIAIVSNQISTMMKKKETALQ